MSEEADARLVMETVAELHKRGYGRLKLFCYIKEGIGAWRHWLFASDGFPGDVSDLPRTALHGSIPWLWTPTVVGNSAAEAANNFMEANPELAAEAQGVDANYTQWYSEMLRSKPLGILEMESPNMAMLDGQEIDTPYSSINGNPVKG